MIHSPHWPIPRGYKDIDLQLQRMQDALAALKLNDTSFPPVIHVAGTNGKGSTIAFMRAILEAAGYKVHVYTSPHLVEFNERIRLAGELITDASLYEMLEETRVHTSHIPLTYFEATTVAALLAFSKVKADVLLLEVGMGGRFDATNIIQKPLVTCITPVSFDHMEFLGNTIEKIAAEKAGIQKRDVPCVISEQRPDALQVIQDHARDVSAPDYTYNEQWKYEITDSGFLYRGKKIKADFLLPNLIGRHQIANAATAIAVLESQERFAITAEHIAHGIQHAQWPARMQRLYKGVLAKTVDPHELWLDGGHNQQGGEILASELLRLHDADPKPLYLIIGMLGTKDHAAYLGALSQAHPEYCVTIPIEGEPSAAAPEILAAECTRYGMQTLTAPSIQGALAIVCAKATQPSRIMICGSLYLAGVVLAENNG